jgi:hypothetical protein
MFGGLKGPSSVDNSLTGGVSPLEWIAAAQLTHCGCMAALTRAFLCPFESLFNANARTPSRIYLCGLFSASSKKRAHRKQFQLAHFINLMWQAVCVAPGFQRRDRLAIASHFGVPRQIS